MFQGSKRFSPFEKSCQRNIHSRISKIHVSPYCKRKIFDLRYPFERRLNATRKSSSNKIEQSVPRIDFLHSKKYPVEGIFTECIKKFHVWLQKGTRRLERRSFEEKKIRSHFVSPAKKGQKDFLRPGENHPFSPFFDEQSYWISWLQNVTKMFSIVGGAYNGSVADPGDPLGEREALHGSSRARVAGIRIPGGNVDSWNAPFSRGRSLASVCFAALSRVQCATVRVKACEKRREKERRERERKEEKERKEEEKERNRSIFQSRSKRRRLRFLLEVIDVGRIALKNAIKISDEGTERRLMDRLSKFIQVDRLVEIENLQIGLRFFRGGVICKAFVIIYWDSYQFSSQYQVISCRWLVFGIPRTREQNISLSCDEREKRRVERIRIIELDSQSRTIRLVS